MRRIRFWAYVPTGRAITIREYDFSRYSDEDDFSQVVDNDLELWVSDTFNGSGVVDEYGWEWIDR